MIFPRARAPLPPTIPTVPRPHYPAYSSGLRDRKVLISFAKQYDAFLARNQFASPAQDSLTVRQRRRRALARRGQQQQQRR